MQNEKPKIKIKKENRGKFTEKCKAKGYEGVTEACIEEGLANYLGTIDLDARKVYKHPDGYIQTEHSFGFSPDGRTELLVPQIIDGKPVTQKEAINHFYKTGEHLGAWDKEDALKKGLSEKAFYDSLEDYANRIHERQAQKYRGK